MNELIVFPDAAAIVIAQLRDVFTDQFDTAEVHEQVPNPRPDRFVTVTRIGGPQQNLVADAPQITVESWALTPADAHDLAQLARAGVNAMRNTVCSDVQVYFVNELSGPALLPDPASDQARYVQNFQLSLRGTAAQ